MGLWETETFSFIGPRYLDMIRVPEEDIRRNCVVISNPLGKDTSIMRTTALPSMLDVLLHNQNHKNLSAAMYELATIYLPRGEDTLPDEKKVLVVGMYGGGVDFYRLKGICERVIPRQAYPVIRLMPCATIRHIIPEDVVKSVLLTVLCCVLGQMYLEVAEGFELSGEIYAAEIDVEAIFDRRISVRSSVSCRSIRRCGATSPLSAMRRLKPDRLLMSATKLVGSLLNRLILSMFTVASRQARGKSVSVRVHLRASDRTLTDAEADDCSENT